MNNCKECGLTERAIVWRSKKIAGLCISCSRRGKRNYGWGIKRSPEIRQKIREGKLGEKNPIWKGDSVGYHALHRWVCRHLQKAKLCASCRKRPPHDLANISQKYKRDLTDWEWLCRKCHMMKDGRSEKLSKRNEAGRVHPKLLCAVCRTAFWSRKNKVRFCSKKCYGFSIRRNDNGQAPPSDES